MNLLLSMIVATIVTIPDVLGQNDATDSTTSSPSLNCDFLNNLYESWNYNGECCNSDAVEYLDTEYPNWRRTQRNRQKYFNELFEKGLCNVSSTSTVEQSTTVLTSTTTVPETTTSTATTTESVSTILMTEVDLKSSRKYGEYTA